MRKTRSISAVAILFLISILLTAFVNGFAGIIHDFAANLYLTGIASLVCSLVVHQVIVRRVLPRNQIVPQLVGVALSGVLSIVLWDFLRDVTAHITFNQRDGSGIKWGDDGMASGLPRSAYGLSYSNFLAHLPVTLKSGVLYGVVWFPALALLERWTYADRRNKPAEPQR